MRKNATKPSIPAQTKVQKYGAGAISVIGVVVVEVATAVHVEHVDIAVRVPVVRRERPEVGARISTSHLVL